MEILLSLLEIHQFQEYIISSNDKLQMNEVQRLKLPEDLPKSVIVYDEELSLNKKAWRIWHKYMVEGGEYEINISWKLRQQLRRQMNDDRYESLNEQMLLVLFEKCKLEMVQLSEYSHDRFKNNDDYEQIESILRHNCR